MCNSPRMFGSPGKLGRRRVAATDVYALEQSEERVDAVTAVRACAVLDAGLRLCPWLYRWVDDGPDGRSSGAMALQQGRSTLPPRKAPVQSVSIRPTLLCFRTAPMSMPGGHPRLPHGPYVNTMTIDPCSTTMT